MNENKATRLRHGDNRKGRRTKEYRVWAHIIGRCNNKNDASYRLYGGRGISVCERWRVFENFLIDMGRAPEGLTLDRKDNNGNYEPSNCRWATPAQQSRNTRRNIVIDGLCLKDYCQLHNIGYDAAQARIRRRKAMLAASTQDKREGE
jgi:hypothetical protein